MAEVSDVKVDIEILCTGVVHGTGLAGAALCFPELLSPTRYFNNPLWIKEVTVKGAMT